MEWTLADAVLWMATSSACGVVGGLLGGVVFVEVVRRGLFK